MGAPDKTMWCCSWVVVQCHRGGSRKLILQESPITLTTTRSAHNGILPLSLKLHQRTLLQVLRPALSRDFRGKALCTLHLLQLGCPKCRGL